MMVEVSLIVIGCILTVMGTLLIGYFRDLKNDVKAMSKSMVDMNIKLETVITKHDNTESMTRANLEEINKLRDRLYEVESILDLVKDKIDD